MKSPLAELSRLFREATNRPADGRQAFLHEACPDPAVRAAVERLVAIDDSLPADFQDTGIEARAWARAVCAIGEVPAGERIDRYRLLSVVGRGGHGIVYRAVHEQLDRICAVKIVPTLASSAAAAARLEREARALALLRHPGITEVYDAGVVDDRGVRLPFIAMEYVDGIPITRFAEVHHLDDRARIRLLALLAEALDYAHAHGLVHRDIKPANVLVAGTPLDPRPKLLDFGIAAVIDESRSATAGESAVVGTLAYMSPEQVRGDMGVIDRRTDVYSLGVLACELLTGRVPVERDTSSVLKARRSMAVESVVAPRELRPSLSVELDAALGSALRARPAERPQSAGDFVRALEGAIGQAPELITPRILPLPIRHRIWVEGAFAALLAACAGIAVMGTRPRTLPTPANPSEAVAAAEPARMPRGPPGLRPVHGRDFRSLELGFTLSPEGLAAEIARSRALLAVPGTDERRHRVRLGIMLVGGGRLDEGIAELRGVVDADWRLSIGQHQGVVPPVVVVLGWAYVEAGEHATAIELLGPYASDEACLAALPDFGSQLRAAHGAALILAGDHAQGMDQSERAKRELQALLGAGHRATQVAAIGELAALERSGQLDAAARRRAEIVGPLHPHAVRIAEALGVAWQD